MYPYSLQKAMYTLTQHRESKRSTIYHYYTAAAASSAAAAASSAWIYLLCKKKTRAEPIPTSAGYYKRNNSNAVVKKIFLGIFFLAHHKDRLRVQRLINLEIPVLVQSLNSSNIELG